MNTKIKNFTTDLSQNALAGFLVFLIALPLCMGIAMASGFPAVAGIVTAIVGGLVTPWFSNSELTIKGPAAGLIVIVLGAVTEFGYTGGQNLTADLMAYRMALGVGVAAGFFQIVFGLMRSGLLGEAFPASAVHGMLAAIGVIIMAKQLPVALGETAAGGPLQIIMNLPHYFMNLNPEIALVGVFSLAILVFWPRLKGTAIGRIPSQLIVVGAAIVLGRYFDLEHPHHYSFFSHMYDIGDRVLVSVPAHIQSAVVFPSFQALTTAAGWKWVFMFTFIGSLESVLSAKAVDLVDPQKRTTDLNKDLLAVGIANTIAACLGGLPMISEIVRSKANADSGATRRTANMFHGIFLMIAVMALGSFLHQIPLAALAAMLVYTGFRLAHPREFLLVYKVGRDQLIIFTTTIITTLATDLLVGIMAGLGVKVLLHLYHGVRPKDFMRSKIDSAPLDDKNTVELTPHGAAVFTHWISMRKRLENEGIMRKRNIVVNLSQTKIVDHTIMEKLHEFQREFAKENLELTISGLENHRSSSRHPLSVQRQKVASPAAVAPKARLEMRS